MTRRNRIDAASASRAVRRVAGPGDCYPAAEAVYHAAGGKRAGLTPAQVRHEGQSHWFVRGASGQVYDPTARQFRTPVPYEEGVGRGFLTKKASRRGKDMAREAGLRLNGDDALRAVEHEFRLSPLDPTVALRLVNARVRGGLTLERALDSIYYALGPVWKARLAFVNDLARTFPRDRFELPQRWHGRYLVVDDFEEELKLWDPKTGLIAHVMPVDSARDAVGGLVMTGAKATQETARTYLEGSSWETEPDAEPVYDRAELLVAAATTAIPVHLWSNWLSQHAAVAITAELRERGRLPIAWNGVAFPHGTDPLEAQDFGLRSGTYDVSIASENESSRRAILDALARVLRAFAATETPTPVARA